MLDINMLHPFHCINYYRLLMNMKWMLLLCCGAFRDLLSSQLIKISLFTVNSNQICDNLMAVSILD